MNPLWGGPLSEVPLYTFASLHFGNFQFAPLATYSVCSTNFESEMGSPCNFDTLMRPDSGSLVQLEGDFVLETSLLVIFSFINSIDLLHARVKEFHYR